MSAQNTTMNNSNGQGYTPVVPYPEKRTRVEIIRSWRLEGHWSGWINCVNFLNHMAADDNDDLEFRWSLIYDGFFCKSIQVAVTTQNPHTMQKCMDDILEYLN